jgi:hypothetical protein
MIGMSLYRDILLQETTNINGIHIFLHLYFSCSSYDHIMLVPFFLDLIDCIYTCVFVHE